MIDKGDKEFNANVHMISVEYSGSEKGKRVTHFFTSEAEAREQFDLAESNGKYTWICDRVRDPKLDHDVWFAFDWSPKLKYAYPSTGRGNGHRSTETKGLLKKLPQRYQPLDPQFVRPTVKTQ